MSFKITNNKKRGRYIFFKENGVTNKIFIPALTTKEIDQIKDVNQIIGRDWILEKKIINNQFVNSKTRNDIKEGVISLKLSLVKNENTENSQNAYFLITERYDDKTTGFLIIYFDDNLVKDTVNNYYYKFSKYNDAISIITENKSYQLSDVLDIFEQGYIEDDPKTENLDEVLSLDNASILEAINNFQTDLGMSTSKFVSDGITFYLIKHSKSIMLGKSFKSL